MKVYIACDLEGATGVFCFKQTREHDSADYREAVSLLMGDIAAVAEGLREAGVDEIYAMDGHGGGDNFLPGHMAPGVRYITGWPRPRAFPLLDESFDGAILLAYHAMNGTADGVLHHTQSSVAEAKYWYDGVERGEIYQHAVIAGHLGVPVMLVTGDEATCREARDTLGPELPTVAVKQGLSREAAMLLAPDDTHEMLRAGARTALAGLPRLRPYRIKLPVTVRTRCLAAGSLQNPYYFERETEVTDPLDFIPRFRP